MTALTSDQIARIWHELSTYINSTQVMSLDKNDFIATVSAVNSWIDANATAYNNILPAKAKANLSNTQKALLLSIICRIRFEG